MYEFSTLIRGFVIYEFHLWYIHITHDSTYNTNYKKFIPKWYSQEKFWTELILQTDSLISVAKIQK